MNIEAVFPVPIISDIIDIDNDVIEQRCYELRGESTSTWQSEWLDLQDPVLVNLVNIVQDKMQEVSENLYRFKNEYTIALRNYWININNNSQLDAANTVAHLHPAPYFFSMVYYVKCDEGSGPLRLVPPHSNLEYTIPDQLVVDRNNYNARQWSVFPEPKKLVGMPSWLSHYADINTNANDRISIAFNGVLSRRKQ